MSLTTREKIREQLTIEHRKRIKRFVGYIYSQGVNVDFDDAEEMLEWAEGFLEEERNK